jgi:23S rRNA (cytosine1962-C5)-methyltransferase
LQKVGFYYDHRENRAQLMSYISQFESGFKNGVDLFCYAGAWGMCALKAGLKQVTFVDQGDFAFDINKGLELNGFSAQGVFHRLDVFKFLDDAIAKQQKFNVVLCDPPAFAKSYQQKDQALDGYSKLHRKVFKIAEPGALLAFSSCTHYVGHEEFQKNISDAAQKEQKQIQLIYTGIQGWDHPIKSQMDKSNYIKSYFYIME